MHVTMHLKRSTLRRRLAPIGRATLSRRFTRTCSLQMEQHGCHQPPGGLLHHLLTLTLSGGCFLLPYPAVTNCFHFQKWSALCCPDFPLVSPFRKTSDRPWQCFLGCKGTTKKRNNQGKAMIFVNRTCRRFPLSRLRRTTCSAFHGHGL